MMIMIIMTVIVKKKKKKTGSREHVYVLCEFRNRASTERANLNGMPFKRERSRKA